MFILPLIQHHTASMCRTESHELPHSPDSQTPQGLSGADKALHLPKHLSGSDYLGAEDQRSDGEGFL